jgi:hypothetical protein
MKSGCLIEVTGIEECMMRLKNKGKRRAFEIIVLFGIFLLALNGCKNPDGPDADIKANVFVSNECGIAVDVFMDGSFQFSLEYLTYQVIQNVSQGVYNIEAKKKDTEDLVTSDTLNVTVSGDYWVTILSTASLNVINEYGQTLNIYTDGDYQGELDDQESQVFTNVPYGEHILEAAKKADNTLVETFTLEVIENKEYVWTIK